MLGCRGWVEKYICQEIKLNGLKTGPGTGVLDANGSQCSHLPLPGRTS